MGKKSFTVDSARNIILKNHANQINGKMIILRGASLDDGRVCATSAGIKTWGAIDYLSKYHNYIVKVEAENASSSD